MSQIISWEYYSSLFLEVPQEAFERLNKRAEIKVNLYTHNRIKGFLSSFNEATATDFQRMQAEAVKTAVCELINKLYDQETSGVGRGVISVSNEGRSESYKITTEAEKEKELESIIRKNLSGTGLAGAL